MTSVPAPAYTAMTHIYDEASGGAEHCQLGAVTLWHQHLFDRLTEKFGEISVN
jgi:hypothetical protein